MSRNKVGGFFSAYHKVDPNAFFQDLINNVLISVINLKKITFCWPNFSFSSSFVSASLMVLQIIVSASDTPCADQTIRSHKFLVDQHLLWDWSSKTSTPLCIRGVHQEPSCQTTSHPFNNSFNSPISSLMASVLLQSELSS